MRKILYKGWKNPTQSLKIHILCWTVFIIYEVVIAGILAGFFPFAHYFLFYILNISFFYFHSSFLLNYLSKNPLINIWRIPIFIIFELFIYLIVTFICTQFLNKFLHDQSLNFSFLNYQYLSSAAFRAIQFILYGTGYYFLINYIRKREKGLIQDIENEKLKNEVLRAEQDFLRAQINPHLLFNTLSFIKYAAKKKPAEADEAVIRLSGIMSFALESNNETTLVSTELEQVENIIGLNQLRYNHKLHINYLKSLKNDKATIIPIVILTLVENIFKHGMLLEEEFPAKIYIESDEHHLLVQTSNLPNLNSHVVSNNKGLANIRSRMDQHYGNNYSFTHELDDNLFKVELRINYQNN
jgi:two-component system LytT family sensor kinase